MSIGFLQDMFYYNKQFLFIYRPACSCFLIYYVHKILFVRTSCPMSYYLSMAICRAVEIIDMLSSCISTIQKQISSCIRTRHYDI